MTISLILAAVAAAIHGYIFVLEAFQFERPRTLAIFGVRRESVAAIKPWAFNQGFYNLFLGIEVAMGIALVAFGQAVVGTTLVAFGCASMVAAAAVLIATDRAKLRPAMIQGAAPLLALAALLAS
ncbi:MAG: DUF1304 domain-containing protein [Micropruina sp.]